MNQHGGWVKGIEAISKENGEYIAKIALKLGIE